MSHDDPARHNRRSIRLAGYDYASPGAFFVTIVAQGRACLFGKIVDGEIHLNDAGRMVWRWWEELGRKFSNCVPGAFVVMPNHVHGVVQIVDDDFSGGRGFGGNDGAGGHDDLGAHDNSGAYDNPGAHTGAPLRIYPGSDDSGAHDDPGANDNSGARDDLGAYDNSGAHIGAPLPDAGEYDDSGAHTGAPLPEIVQWFKTMTTNEYIRGVKSCAWTPFIGKLWQRNYYDHIVHDEAALSRIEQYILDNPRRWAMDDENPDRIIHEK
jgi:putative transposase